MWFSIVYGSRKSYCIFRLCRRSPPLISLKSAVGTMVSWGARVREWVKKASQVEMGGALLSGGHQSSSPFIVGFAGVILAQEGLRRAKLLSRMMNRKHSAPSRVEIWRDQLPQVRDCCWGEPENTVTFPRSINYRKPKYLFWSKKN